jgi:hypothetical protein
LIGYTKFAGALAYGKIKWSDNDQLDNLNEDKSAEEVRKKRK